MSLIALDVERPVAGGHMLARHEGRVVFVLGAIPGERVRVQIDRTTKHAAWARVVEVDVPSADRRPPRCDQACGGLSFAHIAYERQRTLKAEIIADALRRIGRVSLDAPVDVAPSPEEHYRLRARLHLRGSRAGFFREGSHTWCDAAATGQLLPETLPAVDAALSALGSRVIEIEAVTVAENILASERVLHLEPLEGARLGDLKQAGGLSPGISGVTAFERGRVIVLAGSATVTDRGSDLFSTDLASLGSDVERATSLGNSSDPVALVTWTRHAPAFFQGNRYLTGALVRRVISHVSGERVGDLYAGVGAFSVPLAAEGRQVVAIEGDPLAAADLAANAGPWRERLKVIAAPVERGAAECRPGSFDTIVVDPPRTGLSPEAMQAVIGLHAPRLVYVSCDPPTLARDAAKLLGAGYVIRDTTAFDLFPNTPHVETVMVFDR